MRGSKAKRLRRAVYGGGGDYRVRSYHDINRTWGYRTGGSFREGYLWGWWFYLYTRLADSKRRTYQRMKLAT